MFYYLNPIQKLAVAALTFIVLSFCGYVGSWYLNRPAPIVLKQERLVPVSQQLNTDSKEKEDDQAKIEDIANVHVAGAVQSPGLYQLTSKHLVNDAIGMAGGTLYEADLNKVNLAAKLKDGMQIQVPIKTCVTQKEEQISTSVSNTKQEGCLIDINTASEEELKHIPGIGPSIAAKIIEYRKNHQGFRSIDELVAVNGIGVKKLAKIRSHLKPITNL